MPDYKKELQKLQRMAKNIERTRKPYALGIGPGDTLRFEDPGKFMTALDKWEKMKNRKEYPIVTEEGDTLFTEKATDIPLYRYRQQQYLNEAEKGENPYSIVFDKDTLTFADANKFLQGKKTIKDILKVDEKTAGDVYKEKLNVLGLKVLNGRASNEEQDLFYRLTGKKAPEEDDIGELLKDITGLEKTKGETKKELVPVEGSSLPQEITTPVYSEATRKRIGERIQSKEEEYFWMQQANNARTHLGADLSGPQLKRTYEAADDIVKQVMNAYHTGELQKNYPIYTPEKLREMLPDIINRILEEEGIDMFNYELLINFDRELRALRGQ